MARKPEDFPADENPSGGEENVISDRVQELTWALLDECATEEDVALLDNLLLSDANARKSYIECIQLHTDLTAHYAAPTGDDTASDKKSPVLRFLHAGMPLGLQSPPVDDAVQ